MFMLLWICFLCVFTGSDAFDSARLCKGLQGTCMVVFVCLTDVPLKGGSKLFKPEWATETVLNHIF